MPPSHVGAWQTAAAAMQDLWVIPFPPPHQELLITGNSGCSVVVAKHPLFAGLT
jgi:hypothetical protein